MYRETVSIWDLLGAEDVEFYRDGLLRKLASTTRCPLHGSCSRSGQDCVLCWRRALDRVEEVVIKCDV